MPLVYRSLFVLHVCAFLTSVLGECPGPSSDCDDEVDDVGFLQKPPVAAAVPVKYGPEPSGPKLIPLRKESFPVMKNGKVMSARTTFSGVIHVGSPHPNEFRVVFDTGSAHIVLPSSSCNSKGCQMHRQYDVEASVEGRRVRSDGSPLLPGRSADSVTIGFGTASITGEFARDQVCVGPAGFLVNEGNVSVRSGPCVMCHLVMATRLSQRPFEQFSFDGLFGLSLSALALHEEFSVFDVLVASGQLREPQFAFFFDAEGTEGSELAIGGHNPRRALDPISWVPLQKTRLGYWQVSILAIYINGTRVDVCDDGDCYGILDSGTSHLGVPAVASEHLNELLTIDAGSLTDCRQAPAPSFVLELSVMNLTMYPRSYMRTLPLTSDFFSGANLPTVSPGKPLDTDEDQENDEAVSNRGDDDDSVPSITENIADDVQSDPEGGEEGAEGEQEEELLCTPKLLPVDWPAPVGPKVFILGEPLLQSYYTVFDWKNLRAGFSRAAQPSWKEAAPVGQERLQDEVAMLQLTFRVTVRVTPVQLA